MNNEVWKDIPKYEGIYQASSLGRIRSIDRFDGRNHWIKGVIMSPSRNRNGYWGIRLFKEGRGKSFMLHRLIASAFLGEEPRLDVNHKDGDKSNNSIVNLEWCTRAENLHHAYTVLGRSGVCKGKLGAQNKLSKPIDMFSLNGEFIRTFAGANEASRVMNIQQSEISKTAYGKRNHAGGYKWKYKEII